MTIRGRSKTWHDLPGYNRSREAILHMLNEGGVRSTDRRAVFVGAQAYEQAGGTILRDLFDVDGDGGFFADAGLLERLAREKLQAGAEAVSQEGWRWVMAEPELGHSALANMRRVFPVAVPLSAKQRKQLRKLRMRYDAVADRYRDDDDMPADVAARLQRLEAAIEAFDKRAYKPRDIANAGAIITLGYDGTLRIERGLVRAEDEPKPKASVASNDEATTGERPSPLSEKLVMELTAHRTCALRNELAMCPPVALAAITHVLALDTFFHGREASCVEIAARPAWLGAHAPGIDESLGGQAIAERHAQWQRRMPDDSAALWEFIVALPEGERLALLAHCVSLSVNALGASTQVAARTAHAKVLAHAVALDMTTYWQATAASYLGRVSKESIIDAVREGASGHDLQAMSRLKRPAMAEAAEAVLAGKNWLPPLLRLE
jgi:ParB family chromosome partitioning protein